MTAQLPEMNYKQRIFAVDIGTRSVIGLVGYFEDGKLIVEHGEVQYHKDRVMIDGQIHEIDGVAKSIQLIKEKLEAACGQTFHEVAIAAAGRSLVTARHKLEQVIDELIPIKKHVIENLESECLQNIYAQMLEESHEMKDYFCIGHTVVNYYLSDKMMLSLEGHKGNKIGVDLVATFLPRTVVDSLYTSVSRIGLDVCYLTLEPIAAIEVAVPSNIRLLNIALVDIGAGTSDIAITKDGTVVAYAMTSTAGDEITEALAKAFLLDFDSAEQLKCNLSEEKTQRFTDIFGIEHEKQTDEVLDQLMEVMDVIAKNIADSVLEKNGKSPSAVFLTGGGSKIPRLNQLIANYFNLPVERVSTRDMKNIPNLQVNHFPLTGPEVITPIGILAKAISHFGKDFVEVYVNDSNVKLFHTKKLMVMDALALVGIHPHSLIAKAGKPFTVYLNGRSKKLFGEVGVHGSIQVNGNAASISTPIVEKDKIVVIPAKEGSNPSVTLGDVIPKNKRFLLNDSHEYTLSNITLNGKMVSEDMQLVDQDEIQFEQIVTVDDLRKKYSISDKFHVFVNGVKVENPFVISDQDKIETVEVSIDSLFDEEQEMDMLEDYEEDFLLDEEVLVEDTDEGVLETEKVLETKSNDLTEFQVEQVHKTESPNPDAKKPSTEESKAPATMSILYNGKPLDIPRERDFVFVKLFDYIDFDRSRPQGSLYMTLNGRPVSYFDPIKEGDVIEIKWVETVL